MTEPRVFAETDDWACVIKPHGMPTAPLRESDVDTLVSWFLDQRPQAACVSGRKACERGLVHRLDTATWGLVLFAKTQAAYEELLLAQGRDELVKTYTALVRKERSPLGGDGRDLDRVPLTIESGFRPWGPKGREVRPIFPGDARFMAGMRSYATAVLQKDTISSHSHAYWVVCSLTRGYRHQVRAHLSSFGHPILCDPLYSYEAPDGELALYATGISFPLGRDGRRESLSLQPPDRTIP
jgi:23S rRNA pseudouridine1911/1915/1917 synthase